MSGVQRVSRAVYIINNIRLHRDTQCGAVHLYINTDYELADRAVPVNQFYNVYALFTAVSAADGPF